MANIQNQEIFTFLSGTDDNGKSIAFNIETKKNHASIYFEHSINPAEILIEIEQGNNITVMMALDDAPFKEIGVVNAGMTRLPVDIDPETGDFPKCREVSIAIREFSKSSVIINQLALSFYELTEETEDVPAGN